MRDALSNASFIGFTGTPIELADNGTYFRVGPKRLLDLVAKQHIESIVQKLRGGFLKLKNNFYENDAARRVKEA